MPRLRSRTYYTLIASFCLLGAGAAVASVWFALQNGSAEPWARGPLAGAGAWLALGIAPVLGGTFGGLLGVIVATLLDRPKHLGFRRSDQREEA